MTATGNEAVRLSQLKTQIDALEQKIAAMQYTLPAATASTLGGVKVGEGLAVTGDGTLSASGGSGGGSDNFYYFGQPTSSVSLGNGVNVQATSGVFLSILRTGDVITLLGVFIPARTRAVIDFITNGVSDFVYWNADFANYYYSTSQGADVEGCSINSSPTNDDITLIVDMSSAFYDSWGQVYGASLTRKSS